MFDGSNQTQNGDENQKHSTCKDPTNNRKICHYSWSSSIHCNSNQDECHQLKNITLTVWHIYCMLAQHCLGLFNVWSPTHILHYQGSSLMAAYQYWCLSLTVGSQQKQSSNVLELTFQKVLKLDQWLKNKRN